MSREDIRAVDNFPASLRVQVQNSQSCRNTLMGMQESTVLSTIGAHPSVNSHERSLPDDFHKQGGVGWGCKQNAGRHGNLAPQVRIPENSSTPGTGVKKSGEHP